MRIQKLGSSVILIILFGIITFVILISYAWISLINAIL
jgi:hypothetical protein